MRDYGCAVLGAGDRFGGGIGAVGDDSVRGSLGLLNASPIVIGLVEIKPGSLHCASPRVREDANAKKRRGLASVGMTGLGGADQVVVGGMEAS